MNPLLALRVSVAMRMMPFKKSVIASLLAAVSLGTQGAGLGDIKIKSSLGEPLNAEVDLFAVTKDDVSSLEAKLAAAETYSKRELHFDPALRGSRIAVLQRADGGYYLRITSDRPINEPFIDLLIEMSWGGGQLLRAYSSFIDPPGYLPGVQVAAARNNPPVIAEPPTVVSPPSVPPISSAQPSEQGANASIVAEAASSPSEIQQTAPEPAAAIQPVQEEKQAAAVADPAAAPSPLASIANESEEARQARLAELTNEAASEAANSAVSAEVSPEAGQADAGVPDGTGSTVAARPAQPPRLSQAPRSTPAAQAKQGKRPASATSAAPQAPKPRSDVLQVAATGVRKDPAWAAEEKAMADLIRSLEAKVRAKQIELSDIDLTIAALKAGNPAAGAPPIEEQNIAKKGPLKDIDQNSSEMVPAAAKAQATEGNSMVAAGANGEALSKARPSNTMERTTVAVASTPTVRVAPPKGASVPAPEPEEESFLEDPLVLGGGALALALVGGLGTWRYRRRRAAS